MTSRELGELNLKPGLNQGNQKVHFDYVGSEPDLIQDRYFTKIKQQITKFFTLKPNLVKFLVIT